MMNEALLKLLKDRYFLPHENSWQDLAKRVSELSPQIDDLIEKIIFIPSSPTLMNGNTNGLSKGTLSSCFPMFIDDDLESIMTAMKECAFVTKDSGGVGYNLSKLRGHNEIVSAFGRYSSGPIPFIGMLNSVLDGIQQGGRRRGAGMALLEIDHPSILQFIRAKENLQNYTRFNFSIGIWNWFYEKLENNPNEVHFVKNRVGGEEIPLLDEKGNLVTIKELWDLIIHHAWLTAEPGIINLSIANNQAVTIDTPIMIDGKEIIFKEVLVNPCSEFVNIPYSSCNLGSINLTKLVKKGKFDWDEYEKVIVKATYFLDDIIDINKFPIKKIEDVTKAIRPIGLGMMGLANTMSMIGIGYGTEEGIKFTNDITRYLTLRSMKASVDRAKEKGTYPVYDHDKFIRANTRFFKENKCRNININELKEDIKKYGVRNSCFTSIAPTGSLSTIAEVSSGIEPVFALTYMRKVEKKDKTYDIMYISDKVFDNYLNENFSSDQKEYILKKVSADKGSCQKIDEIPENIRKIFVTAGDLTPDQHLDILSVVARNTSLSVSKTLNFPNNASKEDVAKSYIRAYKEGIIGVTVYRDGCREGILVHNESSQIEERNAPKRPESLPCDVYRIKVTGEDWVVFVGMYKDHPYEVFAGKVDLVSIPSSINNGEIKKAGKGRYAFVHNGEIIIKDVTKIFDSGEQEALTRQISTNLRHGTPIDFVCDQLSKSKGNIVDFNKAILRALKRYQKKKELEEKCPSCGGKLLHMDGCVKCENPECGFSRCG